MFLRNLRHPWNQVISKIGGSSMVFALTLVLICVFLLAIGQFTMKVGMGQVGEITTARQLFNLDTLFRMFTNPYVLTGILLYGISLVLWLGAMSTLNISLMYPLASLAYVVAAVIAVIFLKEDVTLLRWAGILVILGGSFLITRTG